MPGCCYCHGLIEGVEPLQDSPDVVMLYPHTTCLREERTCPDCNNPLQPPESMGMRPHGDVCEGCRMYYDENLMPVAKILSGGRMEQTPSELQSRTWVFPSCEAIRIACHATAAVRVAYYAARRRMEALGAQHYCA